MKHYLFLFVALSPATAMAAGFAGHWSGPGKVASNIGLSSNCPKVEIQIAEEPGKLTITQYHSDCASYGSTWGPDVMTVKDGKVFEDEDEVGTLTNDTLMTISHDGSVDYAFNLKRIQNADGTETLKSYYGVQNAIGSMATEADLKRTSP